MAFELGTYGSSVFSPALGWALPEPGDAVTWDWMDGVGLFTQRFCRMATLIATIADGGTQTFTYTALRNDYFPPYLRAYYNSAGIGWRDWVGTHWYQKETPKEYLKYTVFCEIGLGTAKFINKTGASRAFLLIGYL